MATNKFTELPYGDLPRAVGDWYTGKRRMVDIHIIGKAQSCIFYYNTCVKLVNKEIDEKEFRERLKRSGI